MATKRIAYRSGYKYQLAKAYSIGINIKPGKDIKTKFIKLDRTGKLTIVGGYAWDGPSGPVVDTKENMRASLVHDALYQLMRNGKLTARPTTTRQMGCSRRSASKMAFQEQPHTSTTWVLR